jgi:hypothetical protein
MTEAEWLACEDPHPMLACLRELDRLSTRGWRLFAVACCRRLQTLIKDRRSLKAVDIAEGFATHSAAYEELDAAYDAAFDVVASYLRKAERPQWSGPVPEGYAAHAACYAAHPDESADDVAHYARQALGSDAECGVQVVVLRDIFGNPFRPVAADPGWRTSTVVALARQMYESRDFAPMPVLADALQDAGCDHPDVLDHCRGPGPHVRGCWVVDLILGKQ